MKRVITAALLMLLLVSSLAGAEGRSRLNLSDPGNHQTGTAPPDAPDSPADVFIASSNNGGTFTDLSSYYAAAFVAAGAASATAITDGANAPFNFPVPFTAAQYGTVAILSNENFWGPGNGNPEAELNVSLQDEGRIAAYMDTGGTLLFSGQDYLYARGNGGGFPFTYLGISSYTDDVNFGDDTVNYTGVAGGAMAGLSGTVFSSAGGVPCWMTPNTFYTDDVVPRQLGLLNWNSATGAGQGGTTHATAPYRTVFTTVELACTTNSNQFNRDIASIYNYLRGGATAVEPATWGQIKSRFSN